MNPACNLVYFPPLPFTLETLTPKRPLAVLAAFLRREGIDVRVHDFGTVESLEAIFSQDLRGHLIHLENGAPIEGKGPRSILKRFQSRRFRRALHDKYGNVLKDCIRGLRSNSDAGAWLFWADNGQALRVAQQMARDLRASGMNGLIGVWGPVFEKGACFESTRLGPFDGLLSGPCDVAARGLAQGLRRGRFGASVPGFTPSGATGPHGQEGGLEERILPLYDREVYPSLYENTKIRLFEVALDEGTDQGAEAGTTPLFPREASAVDEMNLLHMRHRVHAFHLNARGTGSPALERFGHSLLSLPWGAQYDLEGSPLGLRRKAVRALKSSGCTSVCVLAHSGSQRLISDYYGLEFTVTELESSLRVCRFSGMFTEARFTYPTPEDDYHTRAETLRVIGRTLPHSVIVTQPLREAFGTAVRTLRREALTPEPAYASGSHKTARDYADLVQEVGQLGSFTDVSSKTALLAGLCGFAGRENDFTEHVSRQFLSGDVIGVSTAVELLNRSIALPPDATACRSMAAYLHVVGN